MTMDYGYPRLPRDPRPVPYGLALAAELVCAAVKGGTFVTAATAVTWKLITLPGVLFVACVVGGCLALITPWPSQSDGPTGRDHGPLSRIA